LLVLEILCNKYLFCILHYLKNPVKPGISGKRALLNTN
jgi:hypothetical protein